MNKNKALFLILACLLTCYSCHKANAADGPKDHGQAVAATSTSHVDEKKAATSLGTNATPTSGPKAGEHAGMDKANDKTDEPPAMIDNIDGDAEEYNDPANDIVEQLVLVEEGISQVLAILEKLTGKTVLKEKIPDSKISLEIQQPMTRAEAILAIESVLALNNVATIDMGDGFIKAVVAKNTSSHAPELVDESLRDVVASQKAYSKFFTLKYLDAGEFNKLIKPMVTNGLSQVIHFQSSNSLLIVDTLANLQRIEEVVKRVDVPIDIKEEMYFHVLSNVKAASVVKCIRDICSRGSFKKYFSSNITIESDEPTNQLIIMAPSESLSVIKKIIKNLDVNKEPLTRTEVIRIKHGSAKEISELMRKIINEQRKQEDRVNSYKLAQQEAQAQRLQNSTATQTKSAANTPIQLDLGNNDGIGEHDIQFSSSLAIENDERSNSIIVYGTPSDILQVKSIVNKLDILLDQVRIEVVIAQVTLDKNQVSGLDSFNLSFVPGSGISVGNGGSSAGNSSTSGGNSGGSDSVTPSGSRGSEIGYGFYGADKHFSLSGNLRNFSLNSVFNKAKTDSNVKIMSAPTIVTTHNREAVIEVGESMPILESSISDSNTGGGIKSSITYKNVGIMLKVKPLIGNNGIIQLEIEQKIEKKVSEVEFSAAKQPVISTKHATSFVSVADMDVVVMAGLQEKITENGGGKLWLLGDLPLLGDTLFSSRKKRETTTELIIFIKPTIILQPQDEEGYLNKRILAAGVKKDFDNYNENGKFDDGEPFPNDTLFGLQLAELKRTQQEIDKREEKLYEEYLKDPENKKKKGRKWRTLRKKHLAKTNKAEQKKFETKRDRIRKAREANKNKKPDDHGKKASGTNK
ncbi:MAG: hypothetical protein LBH49_00660 [Puniceicoccales bacterium]|jgi:general secretion pathway protein D|nr:hypothetical protein [Puniceicoccales bacterium]